MAYKSMRDDAFRMRVRSLYPELEAYIDRNYVEEKAECSGLSEPLRKARPAEREERSFCMSASAERPEKKKLAKQRVPECAPAEQSEKIAEPMLSDSACMVANDDYDRFVEESENVIKERLNHLSDTFQEYLLYLIESKGLTNADVYKRALLTKQLFSKIKRNPDYHPDKATAMRLCIGAKLNLDETKDLLARAGYALSPCEKRDVIFSYFIEKEVYDMIEIDIALEEHGVECFIAL
ncbi:MAG: hypothetical protein IJ006_07535 [Lachnospiraceae bacterium]|nr:hypothetical protein [Lachnospiraceae bacterium]